MLSLDAEGQGMARPSFFLMKNEHNPNNFPDEQSSSLANAACIDSVKHLVGQGSN